MKVRIENPAQRGLRVVPRVLCLYLMTGVFVAGALAEVIRQPVSYPPDVIAGWPDIDFDADGTPELAFDFYALGHEWGGVFFLDAHSSATAEVLLENGRVAPLHQGDTVSLTPVLGQWQVTGYQNSVWTLSFSSPRDTNIVVIGEGPPQEDPPPQPPPGQGVGMPGFGDFMGVRFSSGSDWHYAWVRFGVLNDPSSPLPQPGWPGVLEYAYETLPDVPISIPEPAASALALVGFGLCLWRRR